MDLADAIALVKAAGFNVSKPRQTKSLKTVGPTFVAHWIDGVITRMSIHTLDEKPDYRRAVRVSFAAYQSRTRKVYGSARALHGYFERNGKPLNAAKYIDIDQYL